MGKSVEQMVVARNHMLTGRSRKRCTARNSVQDLLAKGFSNPFKPPIVSTNVSG
jgi:hypothetical protein